MLPSDQITFLVLKELVVGIAWGTESPSAEGRGPFENQAFCSSLGDGISYLYVGIDVFAIFGRDQSALQASWCTTVCFWGGSETSESISSFLCSHGPRQLPLVGSFPYLVALAVLSLSHLVAEVHGSQAVHEAILVLEALLCHVEGLLHGHRKGDAE